MSSELNELGISRRGSLIYLVRHGITSSNVLRKFGDAMVEHLTDKGEEQARLLGNALAEVKFTKVFSSNYPRAIETAKIALEQSKHSKEVPLIIDERLRERENFKFIGLPYEVGTALRGKGIESEHPLFDYKDLHIEGLEPISEILTRQESFFDDLFQDLDKGTSATQERVLIVSHGFFIKLLMKHLTIQKKYQIKNLVAELTEKGTENCGYHVINIQHDKHEGGIIYCWNFLKNHQNEHLKMHRSDFSAMEIPLFAAD